VFNYSTIVSFRRHANYVSIESQVAEVHVGLVNLVEVKETQKRSGVNNDRLWAMFHEAFLSSF